VGGKWRVEVPESSAASAMRGDALADRVTRLEARVDELSGLVRALLASPAGRG
jgi:hypothetical protein